jgi:hypothetical protein
MVAGPNFTIHGVAIPCFQPSPKPEYCFGEAVKPLGLHVAVSAKRGGVIVVDGHRDEGPLLGE